MQIKLFHRQSLPGSNTTLREGIETPYTIQLELDGLFDAVLRNLPELLSGSVKRLATCRTEDEFERTYEEAISAAIDHVGASLAPTTSPQRVMCPLCGGGPAAVYEGIDGFLYPFGLMKHLTGHQRSYECSVIASARRRASDSVASSLNSR